MNESAWREYWSGSSEVSAAIAGRNAARLADFWREFAVGRRNANNSLVVDIAAGAGFALAVVNDTLRAADRSPDLCLALDISDSALSAVTKRMTSAAGVACSSEALPLGDAVADIVISQFGLEYAGLSAFDEASRILAPSGVFCAVAHYAGGGIAAECVGNARLLSAVLASGVFDKARAALSASYRKKAETSADEVSPQEESDFSAALNAASKELGVARDGAARQMLERFLADLSRMSSRRFAYEERDALGWIDGARAAISAYLDRMNSMTAAALGEGEIREIQEIFRRRGFDGFNAVPLRLVDGGAPAAWAMQASRS